jgi:4-amino-4-deoxy-L-arabinose transferase-like glycosyltransferase
MNKAGKIEVILLLVLLIAGYFFFNHVIGLRAEEPRRAVVGIETLLGDNALVPAIHGEPYYNKPPVYNWVLAASFIIHDSFSPSAVRFPGVLSLWVIAALLFCIARKYDGKRSALYAAIIFLTFGDLVFYGAVNAGEIDLFYSLIVFLQAIAIFHFHQKRNILLLFLVSYLLVAIGALTKGLPSVAFQGLTLFAYLAWLRDWKSLLSWKHLAGILLFTGIVGGYFLAYSEYEDALAFALNLWSESSSKSANNAGMESIFKAIYSFPLQLIQITLPWSIFFIWSKRAKWNQSPLAVFSLVFITANIWLYWISPELRNRYLYAFFPFLAILISQIISKLTQTERFDFKLSRIGAVLAAIIGVVFIVLPFIEVLPMEQVSSIRFFVCGALFLAVSAFQFRFSQNGFLHIALILAFLRVSYNVCILPVQAAESKATYYANQVKQFIEIADNEEVYWTGDLYTFKPELSLAGKSFMRDSLSTPPLLAYQIPYYFTLTTDSRLLYLAQPKEETWLLGEKQYALNHSGKIYFEFKDKWTQNTLVLYQVEKP